MLHFTPNHPDSHQRTNLLSNNTVHGILEDSQNNLWISTNQGLIRINPETNAGQTYNRGNGLSITEFSDGAFYKDQRTGTLFFGGTNGFVSIQSNNFLQEDYMPQIHLKGLSIFGKEQNISTATTILIPTNWRRLAKTGLKAVHPPVPSFLIFLPDNIPY